MMETIKAFTAEDATVIVGTVIDDTMGEALRVTMVATGLGGRGEQAKRAPELRVLETGGRRAHRHRRHAACAPKRSTTSGSTSRR